MLCKEHITVLEFFCSQLLYKHQTKNSRGEIIPSLLVLINNCYVSHNVVLIGGRVH